MSALWILSWGVEVGDGPSGGIKGPVSKSDLVSFFLQENTPSIDEPKGVGGGDLNKMKEDLRAKVRAMLGSTS